MRPVKDGASGTICDGGYRRNYGVPIHRKRHSLRGRKTNSQDVFMNAITTAQTEGDSCCIWGPRRSLPLLLGSPCILQGRADGMYQKALQFPCCLSPWLGARTRRDQTWACGSCGSPFHCDTSPLYLTAQRHGIIHNIPDCLLPSLQVCLPAALRLPPALELRSIWDGEHQEWHLQPPGQEP